MKERSIKQSGFRALSSEEITAVSGGFFGAGTGSAYWDAILGVVGDFSYNTHHQIAQDGGSDGGGSDYNPPEECHNHDNGDEGTESDEDLIIISEPRDRTPPENEVDLSQFIVEVRNIELPRR